MNGWERPNQTIYIKTLQQRPLLSLRVHPTWELVGIESLLQVVHGMPPPGHVRLIHEGRLLNPDIIDPGQRLSQTTVQDGSIIHTVYKLRGD